MKRREFVEKLGIGSAIIVSSSALSAPGHAAPNDDRDDGNGGHNHQPISGDLANATVSFGQWKTGTIPAEPNAVPPLPELPPLDRFAAPNAPPPNPRYNSHLVIPYVATIKAGGSVNFVISGLHQIAVYGRGTKPEDIHEAIGPGPFIPPFPVLPPNTRAMQGPPFLPLISFATNRLYVGPDPSLLPLDRVEVVHFPEPGRYLVICAFLLHFVDNMYGWVRVRRHEHDND
ncbi:MAG TPA: hypothetical protein VH702_18055 [Vicinamibacterales bacterium]|jgi:hypothetical protein